MTVAPAPAARTWRRTVALLAVPAAFGGTLAACSSLPHIVPDLARPGGPPVQLDGAHGPLSAARSRVLLERLASRGEPTDIFTRHLALEEAIAGSPLTAGNDVRLLRDGPATYAAMFEAIAAARDHINMETYLFEADDVGERFMQALIERQRSGVQVNLIRDSAGTLTTPPAFFQRLADSGARVLEFNPLNPLALRKDWAINQRDHRKLLIVDGRIAFLGGINISSVYSGGSFGAARRPRDTAQPAWRDTDLRIEGPVVAEFQKLFLAAWADQRGPALAERAYFPAPGRAGSQVVRAIGSSPDEPFSVIYATLLSAIGSSETSVHLTTAYFVPDPQLLAALEAAAARGVDVRLLLASQTDSWLVLHAGRAHFGRLLRAGVHIHLRRDVILHAKTALIDGVWSTVGSTNLDWRSFLHNHEVNAVVLGADFGAELQAMFDRDLTASDTVTLADWQRRPIGQRVKEWFATVWAYWL